MKRKRIILLLLVLAVIIVAWKFFGSNYYRNSQYSFGDKVDSLNGVYVYFNGETGTIRGRTVAPDGYNIGLKYQCVEFVKRYYYEHYHHKMPDPYGNAVDFYDPEVEDGEMNKARGLIQYTNTWTVNDPEVGDLIVFDGGFGHVAIVSQVEGLEFEIIQQNPGIFGASRRWIDLEMEKGMFRVDEDRVLGWLRIK